MFMQRLIVYLVILLTSFTVLSDDIPFVPNQNKWVYDISHSIGPVHSFKYQIDSESFLGLTCNQRNGDLFFYLQKGDVAYKTLEMIKLIGYHRSSDTYYEMALLPGEFRYLDLVLMFSQYDRILIGNGELLIGFENPYRDSANELWLFKNVCRNGQLLLR